MPRPDHGGVDLLVLCPVGEGVDFREREVLQLMLERGPGIARRDATFAARDWASRQGERMFATTGTDDEGFSCGVRGVD